MLRYVYFALAGLLVGGMVAMRQQRRSLWVVLGFGVLAAVFLWFGLQVE